jgi:hypothetical protein
MAAREVQTIYLPGDRDLFAFAEAVARDNRLTTAEILAKLAAYRCNVRKWDAIIYAEWAEPWRCSRQEPCLFCSNIG